VISRSDAEAIAEQYVKRLSTCSGLALELLKENTLEKDFGWVFFYDSRSYIDSCSFQDKMVGNAPIIVDRREGAVYETGTAEPIDYYIQNYERFGSPYGLGEERGQS
jgi:hypothetical protein